MRRRIDYGARLVAAVSVIASLASCYGDPSPPPRPTASRVATTVGQVADSTPAGYVLKDGTVVDLGESQSPGFRARRMTQTTVTPPSFDGPGGLLLYGEDEAGTFYGATLPPDDGGCFGLRATGFVEADRLHLSSGLVLPFAPDVELTNDRGHYDPSWLLEFDLVCLDDTGAVTSVVQVPLGV